MDVEPVVFRCSSLGGDGDSGRPLSITPRRVECVGPSFLSFWLADADSRRQLAHAASAEDEVPLQYHQDPDFAFLRQLEPKAWKTQDHYAVLGLKALRFRATQDDVKKAYRAKMLMHHPDKRKQTIVSVEDDYFSCITRAWEVLGNPKTRRSYDSVDKTLDDSIPANNSHNKAHFYRVFGKAFKRNSHWSKVQPVPGVGGEGSTRQEVDHFYAFWYNFQSWREFTYREADDEELSSAEERKLRKSEVCRIRKLVDLAYALDPRISVFKQEEKERKLALKERRKEQARARQEEAAKEAEVKEAEMRLATQREETEAKEIQDLLKAERAKRKRALKASRSKLCKVVKANGYYVADSEELVRHMMGLEDIMSQTFLVDKTEQLVVSLERRGRDAFIKAMTEATCNLSKTTSSTSSKKDAADISSWSEDELTLLAKAVKLYPSDRKYRWVLVADFVNQCSTENAKTSKDVEVKSSEIESARQSDATRMASASDSTHEMSVEDNEDADAGTCKATADERSVAAAGWSESETSALELGKLTYPASTPRRWEKIASVVGSRTRDECLMETKRRAKMEREANN